MRIIDRKNADDVVSFLRGTSYNVIVTFRTQKPPPIQVSPYNPESKIRPTGKTQKARVIAHIVRENFKGGSRERKEP